MAYEPPCLSEDDSCIFPEPCPAKLRYDEGRLPLDTLSEVCTLRLDLDAAFALLLTEEA